jgi:glycopeptide antibiotics resistance protein
VAPGREPPADHTRRQRPQCTGPIVAGRTAEELGNVAIFVPLGVLLALLWPQRRWLAIPIGVTASTAIELLQVALPRRSPSLNDIRWNSVGTTVRFGIVMVTVLVARTIRDDSGGAHAA